MNIPNPNANTWVNPSLRVTTSYLNLQSSSAVTGDMGEYTHDNVHAHVHNPKLTDKNSGSVVGASANNGASAVANVYESATGLKNVHSLSIVTGNSQLLSMQQQQQ